MPRPHPDRVKDIENIKIKYKHRCGYCGQRGELTIDHIKPKSQGGTLRWHNMMPACQPCNCFKADLSLDEFKQKIIQLNPPWMTLDCFYFELLKGNFFNRWYNYLNSTSPIAACPCPGYEPVCCDWPMQHRKRQ